jgi:hypothetical protein
MRREIVHSIADLPTGGELREVRTRCGRTIAEPVVEGDAERYVLVASTGNQFICTTQENFITCQKCLTLVGIPQNDARRGPTNMVGAGHE